MRWKAPDLRIIEGFQKAKSVLSRQTSAEFYDSDYEQAVRQIIDEVRKRGDTALKEYTFKIDGIKLDSLEVSKEQIDRAYRELDTELIAALKLAAERIRSFHVKQMEDIWGGAAKRGSGQLIRPLKSVGLYVPGGTASYPSTVLMTAIPARVAGVEEIILVTPPRQGGVVPPATLAAAGIAGVDRVFCAGGAQAIAALAFGTESIPQVDKICGPGNIYVVLAKKLVYGIVDIDGLQGPSEVVIVADETANPEYCAADLLSQAEHDSLASAILITTSLRVAEEANIEVEQQLADLPRKAIAAKSLQSRGIIAVVDNIDQAIELVNLYAPEHLCLAIRDAASYTGRVLNAGCIFAGEFPTEILGDYVAGPSHVLPTGGTARFSSPLNTGDFIKLINLVDIRKDEFEQLGRAAATIAKAEGLDAHARAVEKRLEKD